VLGLGAQDHKLVLGKRQLRVFPPLIVGEFDFKNALRESLDNPGSFLRRIFIPCRST
jgi:hypothetical protein